MVGQLSQISLLCLYLYDQCSYTSVVLFTNNLDMNMQMFLTVDISPLRFKDTLPCPSIPVKTFPVQNDDDDDDNDDDVPCTTQ